MSRSNYDKPFYVDVGTSVVAIRCASNHDVVAEYDYGIHPPVLQLAKEVCDRMNKEAEIGKPRRNCDVGTPREQERRMDEWCHNGKRYHRCVDEGCPNCNMKTNCVFDWLQMPYEEGGAK